MPETMTVKLEVCGIDDTVAAIDRCVPCMASHCQQLIAMGWTPAMAEKFVGEIAEAVIRELVTVKPT